MTEASTIFESATLGNTGLTGGISVGQQFVGARFAVDEGAWTGEVGGHFASRIPGEQIFGAIVVGTLTIGDETDLKVHYDEALATAPAAEFYGGSFTILRTWWLQPAP